MCVWNVLRRELSSSGLIWIGIWISDKDCSCDEGILTTGRYHKLALWPLEPVAVTDVESDGIGGEEVGEGNSGSRSCWLSGKREDFWDDNNVRILWSLFSKRLICLHFYLLAVNAIIWGFNLKCFGVPRLSYDRRLCLASQLQSGTSTTRQNSSIISRHS